MFVPTYLATLALVALVTLAVAALLCGRQAKDNRKTAEGWRSFGLRESDRADDNAIALTDTNRTWREKIKTAEERANDANTRANNYLRELSDLKPKFERMTTRTQGKGGRFVAAECDRG